MLDNCLNDLVRMTILSLKHCIIQTHTSTKIKSGIKITVFIIQYLSAEQEKYR